MTLITAFNTVAPSIMTLLLIGGIIGGIFAFKNARKSGIILIQDQTIVALNQRLDAQDKEIEALKNKNVYLEQVIETINLAMKKRGVVISVDGEMVTFTDAVGRSSTVRRAKNPPTPPIGTITKSDIDKEKDKEK